MVRMMWAGVEEAGRWVSGRVGGWWVARVGCMPLMGVIMAGRLEWAWSDDSPGKLSRALLAHDAAASLVLVILSCCCCLTAVHAAVAGHVTSVALLFFAAVIAGVPDIHVEVSLSFN